MHIRVIDNFPKIFIQYKKCTLRGKALKKEKNPQVKQQQYLNNMIKTAVIRYTLDFSPLLISSLLCEYNNKLLSLKTAASANLCLVKYIVCNCCFYMTSKLFTGIYKISS